MTVLVYDTETTGLPLFTQPSDDPGQPYIVQLAAELCDDDGNVIERYENILNIGAPIPADTIAIHGITDEIAAARGLPPKQVLADFFALVERADEVVAHNASFDNRMVRIQAARYFGEKWECPKPVFDTCTAATSIIKLPNKPGARSRYKRPTLQECMTFFFGEEIANAHTADADTTACRRVYFAIKAANAGLALPAPKPAEEAPAPIGHNMPDEPLASGGGAYGAVVADIEDLYGEMKLWLDGAAIEGQAQADGLATLIDRMAKSKKAAENAKGEEKRPHLDANIEIEARYKPPINKADSAIRVGKAAQTIWLNKLAFAQREAAENARKIAQEEATKAAAAAQEATKAGNLEAREEAETLIDNAMDLVSTAKMLSGLKATAKGAEAARSISLRTIKTAVLIDDKAALRAFWVRSDAKAQLVELMNRMAQQDVRAGATHVEGYRIDSEEKVI